MHYSWGKIRMSSCIGGPELPSALIIIPVRPSFWQPKENKIKPHLRLRLVLALMLSFGVNFLSWRQDPVPYHWALSLTAWAGGLKWRMRRALQSGQRRRRWWHKTAEILLLQQEEKERKAPTTQYHPTHSSFLQSVNSTIFCSGL